MYLIFLNLQDMVRIVRDKFTIERDASITFETSTLDICKGLSVEIDECI